MFERMGALGFRRRNGSVNLSLVEWSLVISLILRFIMLDQWLINQ
ncbi:MAG: hypothetical protein ACI9E1_000366 [Cryomorphaceae bacterium]|jgi:hypothetical protein